MTKKKPKRTESDYKKLYYQTLKEFNQSLHELDQAKSDNRCLIEDKSIFNQQLVRVTSESVDLKQQVQVYREYKENYNSLYDSLVGCLSNDEKEAADITGCSPDIYAVELFKIYQNWKRTNRLSHEYGRSDDPRYQLGGQYK